MCPPGTDSSAARLPDKRRPSSCLQLAQEDSGKARVLRATGGLVQEVTEHEQLVYGTRALDREPEKDDMGVKEKAALRSPLNYRHGARERDGREGTASSQPHTGYTGRKGLVSKGYHLRGSGCHAVLSGLAFYPYRHHQVHPDWSGEVSMLFSHFTGSFYSLLGTEFHTLDYKGKQPQSAGAGTGLTVLPDLCLKVTIRRREKGAMAAVCVHAHEYMSVYVPTPHRT